MEKEITPPKTNRNFPFNTHLLSWIGISTTIEIISGLFILLFAYTGINKFLSLNSLRFVLKDYPLIGNYPNLIGWGLPSVEIVIVLLLLIPRSRLIGLYVSTIMMFLFTVYLIYMLASGSHLPCTCGGMLKQLTWKEHLIFNFFFILLGLLGIKLSKQLVNHRR